MTTYSWLLSTGGTGPGSSNLIVIQLTQPDGTTPDTAAAPSFVYYGLRTGVTPLPPPTLYHRGYGVYAATVPPSDAAQGVVWLINTGSNPSRVVGATSYAIDPLMALALQDQAGNLWTGAAPSFVVYETSGGTPLTPPTLVKGDRVGVYAFTAAAVDDGAVFNIQAPAGAVPSFHSGFIRTASTIGFVAAQLTLYTVRLTLTKYIFEMPAVTDPANYFVVPADPLSITPTVSAVTFVNSSTLDLTLTTELTTGTYSVTAAANAWLSTDNASQNDGTPATLAATGDPPVLVSAFATTSTTVRVTYSKRMRSTDTGAVSHAVRPANYTVSSRTVTLVTKITDWVYDLTLNTAMSGTHTLSVANSRDLAGNAVVAATISLPYGANPSTLSDPGDVVGNTVLVPAEWRLRQPFPYPTLEFYRQQMLQACSSSSYLGSKGRALLFFTQETDVRAIFIDLFGVTFDVPEAHFVLKRTSLEVRDRVNTLLARLVPRALQELQQAQIPEQYTEMLKTRLYSHDYRDVIAAYAAVVLLAAAVLE